MLNPFFLQGSQTEQGLVQDLINEQLRMYGVEVHYIPRKYATEKTIIQEVIQSKFDQAHPIEAYVNNYEGYGDNTTILSKFGIQATNEIELIISKERICLAAFRDIPPPVIYLLMIRVWHWRRRQPFIITWCARFSQITCPTRSCLLMRRLGDQICRCF